MLGFFFHYYLPKYIKLMDSEIVTNFQVVYKTVTIICSNAHCENLSFVMIIRIFSKIEFSVFGTPPPGKKRKKYETVMIICRTENMHN